jgi:hypothetical protein
MPKKSDLLDDIQKTTAAWLSKEMALQLTSLTMLEAIGRIDGEPDGTRYEDEFCILEKIDGIVTITGKPIPIPLIYTTD